MKNLPGIVFNWFHQTIASMLQDVLKSTKVLRSDIIFSRIPFFPTVVTEWDNLDIIIRNCSFVNVFKKELFKLIRPKLNFTYDIHNTKGLKLFTRLRLWLSHLGDDKFRHNFQDCVSPMCSCAQDIETIIHFLLHYPNHHCARKSSRVILQLLRLCYSVIIN